MAAAFGWGILAASSLVIGALVALVFRISLRAIGLIMAFGAGVLISAVAFDLVEEAADKSSGHGSVVAGIFAGCAGLLRRRLADRPPRRQRPQGRDGDQDERLRARHRARHRARRDPRVDGDRPDDLRGRGGGRRLSGRGLHLQPARSDLLDSRPRRRRLEEVADPVDVDRDRRGLGARLARRLRPVPALLTGHRRVRSRLRGRRDPHHARRHDDARGLQARGKLVGVVTTLGFAVAFTIHLLA